MRKTVLTKVQKYTIHLFSLVPFALIKKPHPYENAICLIFSAFFRTDDENHPYEKGKVKHLDGMQWCITFKFLHFAIISFFCLFQKAKFWVFLVLFIYLPL